MKSTRCLMPCKPKVKRVFLLSQIEGMKYEENRGADGNFRHYREALHEAGFPALSGIPWLKRTVCKGCVSRMR